MPPSRPPSTITAGWRALSDGAANSPISAFSWTWTSTGSPGRGTGVAAARTIAERTSAAIMTGAPHGVHSPPAGFDLTNRAGYHEAPIRFRRLDFTTGVSVQSRFRNALLLMLCASLVPLPGNVPASDARASKESPISVALSNPPARIAVKEPARVRPSLPPATSLRPNALSGVRSGGSRVPGPPMLRPGDIDGVLKTAASARRRQAASDASVPVRRAQSLPADSTASGTGINPWWRYQEENVPGGGHLMVNVGSGNLLVQGDDMSVPHKGIALAFRRTYNSQAAAVLVPTQFASWQSLYGNGWTNTFDAHFVSMSSTLRAVYDIDGARYDYPVPAGWVPSAGAVLTSSTPGQHAMLVFDGACGWMWTKKSGTTYYFYGANPTLSCPWLGTVGGYAGHLYQIIGRNRNTYLTFTYMWDNGDASPSGKINTIQATTESGMTATLTFADFNGRRLLQRLLYPDNLTSVSYAYDALGNLTTVTRPSNNAAGTQPTQAFGYQTIGSDSVMYYAQSPRSVAAGGTPSGCYGDGGAVVFGFGGSSAATSTVSWIQDAALVNPTIPDGTNSGTIQGASYPSNIFTYNTEYFTTGVPTPTYRDSAGHMTNFVVDGTGRPTQTQECTASTAQGQSCTGTWLTTNQTWDANNNLTAETDARGNESDYAYDIDGNTVAAAAPPPAAGASRPTRLFSYDAHDNITAYCDPNATQGLGQTWVSPPTAPVPGQGGLCPQSAAATQYQWSAPTAEPYGELVATISPATPSAPGGYQRTFSYAAGPQGGADYGLPTQIVGATITQTGDLSTPSRQPQQTFWYDGNGDLVCYGTGAGQWILTYDALGRPKTASDPDDSTVGSTSCAKSGAQPSWNTTSHTDYFPDGSVKSKQSGSQYVNGVGTTFTYDLDGNVATETHHYGCLSTASCTAGVTSKWYDGADRLVEVQQPYDMSDVQAYPWSTRYIYDLSQSGVTAYRGMGLAGYGNLVSTQELLSGTVWSPTPGQTYSIATGTWTSVRATSFDALDRPLSAYEAALGDQPKTANAYDASGSEGLLSSVRLATNESKYFTYDGDARETNVVYVNDGGLTPAVQQTYDPDGHVVSRTTATLGAETLGYDATGAVTSVVEPPALGGGTIAYGYYADGLRSSAGYSDTSQSYPAALKYAYRADGKRDRLTLGNGTAFSWTYTAAGRMLAQSDPLTGTTVSPSATYTSNKVEKPYYPSSVTYSPWTQAFDSYGRVASITLPVNLFAYTASQFDLEDGVTQATAAGYVPTPAPPPYAASHLVCLQSSTRNEKTPLALSQQTYCTMGPGAPIELNGAQFSPIPPNRFTSQQNWTIDARAGMMLHNTQSLSGDAMGSSFAYNLSGGLTHDFEGGAESGPRSSNPALPQAWCPGVSPPAYAAVVCYSNGSRAKTYDAENRLHTGTFTYEPYITGTGGPTYSTTADGFAECGSYWSDSSGYRQPPDIQAVDYGATSHPMRSTLHHPEVNGITETRGWLWDDNDRFIECQLSGTSCQTPYLSIEGMADYDLAHGTLIRVNDRNRNGQVAMSRNSTAFSGWSDYPTRFRPNLYSPCSMDAVPPLPYAPAGICGKQRDGKLTADGWSLDYETWQGVRTYDPAIGQWNTPDAYAGEVHDPASQKPFIWNRNDSYDYSDPSGYRWAFVDPSLVAIVNELLKSATFRKSYQAAENSKTVFRMSVVPNANVRATIIPGKAESGIGHSSFYPDPKDPTGAIVKDTITIGR